MHVLCVCVCMCVFVSFGRGLKELCEYVHKCAQFSIRKHSFQRHQKASCSTSVPNVKKHAEKNMHDTQQGTKKGIHINVYTNKIVTFICILCTVI